MAGSCGLGGRLRRIILEQKDPFTVCAFTVSLGFHMSSVFSCESFLLFDCFQNSYLKCN